MCRAKLLPKRRLITRREGEANKNGVTRCNKGKNKNGCAACLYLSSRHEEVVREVKVYNTGEVIPVRGRINCKTEGAFCTSCGAEKTQVGNIWVAAGVE